MSCPGAEVDAANPQRSRHVSILWPHETGITTRNAMKVIFCQSFVSTTSKEKLISGEFQIPGVTQRRLPSRFRGWPCEEHVSLALYLVSCHWPSEKYQI
jgi:hypothetical protein